jgi:hypothetical protein
VVGQTKRTATVYLYLTMLLAACFAADSKAQSMIKEGGIRFDEISELNKGSISEPSGIVYHPGRRTLFAVSDDGSVCELKTDGTLVNKRSLGKMDFEGVTCDPASGLVYIAVEGSELIVELDPDKLSVLRVFVIEREVNGITLLAEGGDGIEAITFMPDSNHAEGGVFMVANQSKERVNVADSSALLKIELPLKSSSELESVGRIIKYIPMELLDI